MMRSLAAAILIIVTPTSALSDYQASSSYCRRVAGDHETLATELSLYVGGALAMSQDGKHCGACYHNKAGRISNNPSCAKAQEEGASSVSEAAVAVCEDRAKRYKDPDPKCRVVKVGGNVESKDPRQESERESTGASKGANLLDQVDLRGRRTTTTCHRAISESAKTGSNSVVHQGNAGP